VTAASKVVRIVEQRMVEKSVKGWGVSVKEGKSGFVK